jgi:AraC-like DNA-binding protein
MSGGDRAASGLVAGLDSAASEALDAAQTSVYAELRPPPHVASHACCVWTQLAGPSGHVQRVLPDGCADIVWMAGGELVVAGPATGPVLAEILPGVTAVGVRFGPGAAGAALGHAAHELQDHTVELADLWGDAGRELAERMALAPHPWRPAILAEAVGRRLRDAPPPDPVVTRAATLLAGGMPVAETGREVALGERHLRRRFHDAVGYGPKMLQRIMRLRRFLDLVEAMPEPDIGRAAVQVGYADQPHLTRESTALTGLPPVALLASRQPRGLADGLSEAPRARGTARAGPEAGSRPR